MSKLSRFHKPPKRSSHLLNRNRRQQDLNSCHPLAHPQTPSHASNSKTPKHNPTSQSPAKHTMHTASTSSQTSPPSTSLRKSRSRDAGSELTGAFTALCRTRAPAKHRVFQRGFILWSGLLEPVFGLPVGAGRRSSRRQDLSYFAPLGDDVACICPVGAAYHERGQALSPRIGMVILSQVILSLYRACDELWLRGPMEWSCGS